MPKRGIKSSVKIDGHEYFSVGVAHASKRDAQHQADNIRKKGNLIRVKKYSFGYVLYGRRK
jgi:hypothetical protein